MTEQNFETDQETQEAVAIAEEQQPVRGIQSRWLKPRFFLLLFLGLGFLGFLYLWQGHFRRPVSLMMPGEVALRPLIKVEFKESSFFQEWKEHLFSKKTVYTIETVENNEKVLHAVSHGASSVLFKQVNVGLSERPFLTWEWKAIRFPSNKKNEALAAKSDNDFAARVYVAFRGRNPFLSDVIEYVWDDHFPEGTFVSSPYLGSTKIFVIQNTGTNPAEKWIAEKRDIVRDYQKLFGRLPRGNVSAIGVMSDSDNTGTEAEAYYRRLSIQKPVS